MKSVPIVSSPAPFVVRHATSDFISGAGAESRGGSPSVSYPLNTVSRSADGMMGGGMSGGVMRISKSATPVSSMNRKMSSTVSSNK